MGQARNSLTINNTNRRTLLLGGVAALGISAWGTARAQTADYTYDALGRLTKVNYPNGRVVEFTYDAAGNRTQVSRTAPFSGTITISGSGPVNLRTLANAAGYGGGDAIITFVNNGTITGDPGGGIGVDTGTWPGGFSIALTLDNNGTIRGGGGSGNGGAGGDAIYARYALSIDNTGGTIQGGGGGGGGGQVWVFSYIIDEEVDHIDVYLAGGGGGGFPNGAAGVEYAAPAPGATLIDNASPGSAGTTGGGGSAGSGGSAGTGRTTGNGGSGGGAATAGSAGGAGSGSNTGHGAILRYLAPAQSGGAAGYAVRKNGNTVTRTGGTVAGTEA